MSSIRSKTSTELRRSMTCETVAGRWKPRRSSVRTTPSASRLGDADICSEFKSSIFCFGGYGGETESLAYVTAADKWVPLQALPTGKVNATACPSGMLDRDRCMIIVGGVDGNGRPSRSAYKFDCNYLVWKPIAPLTVKRDGCGSAFSSGYSFVVGGKSPQEWTNRVEYLNPIANKWTEVSPMKQGREGCGVASLNDVLYVAGGNQYGSRDLNTVEWYDMKRDKWVEGESMTQARWGCGLVSYEGSLYAIGGYKLDSIERFDPREGKWVSLDYLNVRRRRVQAVLYDNYVYVFGGWIDGSRLTVVETYDVRANKSVFSEPLPNSKAGVAMASLWGLFK